jgi:Peptidase family M28
MKCCLSLLLFVPLATMCIADNIVYMRVPRPSIEEHLKLAQDVEAERVRTLRNLFQKAGCPQIIEQEVPKEESPTLICLLPGTEEGTIIVGASLDYAPEEAKDPAHWSALALLPLLAKSLGQVPHRCTLKLVAFPGREHGMRGATWYVSQLTEAQRKTMRAMVDLDNLGRTPAVYALAQSDNTLAVWLQAAAHSLQLATPALVDATTASLLKNSSLAIKDEDLWADAKPFEQAHIPAITVQSATPAMLPALQRNGSIPNRVTGTAFDTDAYEDTYRLLCVYLLYLDGNLGRPLVNPGVYLGRLFDTAGVFATSPIDVSVTIDHFTTTEELNRYEQIVRKGGQQALADALEKESSKGDYRFGLDLASGAQVAALHNSGKTYIFLVAVHLKVTAATPSEYRFTVIKLNLDGKGGGDGLFYNSAKLRFNKKHELEVEDSFSLPDDIRDVRLEHPAPLRTTP